MAKKEPEFTVTDRRKFTFEGEKRDEAAPEQPSPTTTAQTPAPPAATPAPPAAEPLAEADERPPAPPSAAEQQQQADAYRANTTKMDEHLDAELKRQGQTRRAQDFEINFEKFLASLYMTALMQLGLVHEQGAQPQPDLLGARQTIDTIAMLAEKTKGNLTPQESNMLQNILYELRMAYLELTNALARGPMPGQKPGDPTAGIK